MENFTAGTKWGLQYAKVACVTLGCLVSQANAADDIARKETNRRVELSLEAKKLVVLGDAAYEAKDYAEAYTSYKNALVLLPKGPATVEYREAVNGRYAESVVAYSKQLTREGRVEQAQKMLSELLQEDDFKGNKKVASAEAKAFDPIRTNPSATPQNTANVDKVRRLLYKASSSYNLGKYDEATKLYEDILRIDPYNQAARRGMTKVLGERRDYYRSAHDSARAQLLTDVEKSWETEVTPDYFLGNPEILTGDALNDSRIVKGARFKLEKIIIPRFDVENATPEATMNRFRLLVRDNDNTTTEREKQGVNIALNLGGASNSVGVAVGKRKVTLRIANIPADKLLDQICKQLGTAWTANEYTVTVVPENQNVESFFTRQFTVPPNFLSSGVVASNGESDPFADSGSSETVQRVNLTAKDHLESFGVKFPEGSSAFYSKTANVLTVRNNATNMRIIAEAVERIKSNQNVMVNIRIKVLDILEDELHEKGYDWLAGQSNIIGNSTFIGGGNTGNGTQINPVQLNGEGPISTNSVTSGLRSGDGAFAPNTIDARIASGQNLGQVSSDLTRAPAVLQTTGFFNDTNFQVLLRALNLNKGTSRMWSPSVSTRPGERARVENVREFTYPSEYDPPEIPDDVSGQNTPIVPAQPTAFETRPVGAILEVEPTVSADRRYISLDLAPEFSDFVGFVNYGSPITGIVENALTGVPTQQIVTTNDILQPVFEKISTRTTATVADGATVAIGGLTKMEVGQVNDSVPVLGKLPLVGRFFQTNGKRSLKRAVVIFVTAELVDNTGRKWRNK